MAVVYFLLGMIFCFILLMVIATVFEAGVKEGVKGKKKK